MTKRLKLLDSLRALAISLMVLYHMAFDLKEYIGLPIDYHSPFWFSLGRASALLFMILSGFSTGLSRNPTRRGLQVLSWGTLITFITYMLMPTDYIRFGILHLLGTSMLLSPFFLRLPPLILFLIAIGLGTTGYWFMHMTVPYAWFLPFGLTYRGFSSIDFYPLFPYLSAPISGILLFKYYQYLAPRRKPASDDDNKAYLKPKRWARFAESLSRHSLFIYLVHQPLLVGGLLVIKHFLGSSVLEGFQLRTAPYRLAPTFGALTLMATGFFVYKLLKLQLRKNFKYKRIWNLEISLETPPGAQDPERLVEEWRKET